MRPRILLPLVAASALALALPAAPGAVGGPATLVCSASITPVGTSNGDGTWHYDVTAAYLCAVEAEGYLSVTDDFENIFHFETCRAQLQCAIHVEGEAYDGDCLHIAAFTVATVYTRNDSQQLCAPPG